MDHFALSYLFIFPSRCHPAPCSASCSCSQSDRMLVSRLLTWASFTSSGQGGKHSDVGGRHADARPVVRAGLPEPGLAATLTRSHTHSLAHPRARSRTLTHPRTHAPTHLLTRSLTPSLTRSLAPSLSPSLPPSLPPSISPFLPPSLARSRSCCGYSNARTSQWIARIAFSWSG